jgi:hypothetical protein
MKIFFATLFSAAEIVTITEIDYFGGNMLSVILIYDVKALTLNRKRCS